MIKATLVHHGFDDWRCDYVKVIFDDRWEVKCTNTNQVSIDNDETLDLDCGAPYEP